MYGFVLQAVADFLAETFPPDVVEKIIAEADLSDGRTGVIDSMAKYQQLFKRGFSIYQPYSDSLMTTLLEATATVTNVPQTVILEKFGPAFLKFVVDFGGFQLLMDLLGRDFVEFLKNLDVLHEYLRHTFPKIRPPSFTIVDQNLDGIKVAYKTCRNSFSCLATGLLRGVAEKYYGLVITTSIEQITEHDGYVETILALKFDNIEQFIKRKRVKCRVDNLKLKPMSADWLFGKLMPFHIAFIQDKLEIISVGSSLAKLFPKAVGCEFSSTFEISLPRRATPWSWMEIGQNLYNLFEIECTIAKEADQTGKEQNRFDSVVLILRGQMVWFGSLACLVFIGVPCFENVKDLTDVGLFTGDLGKTDCSRYVLSAALHRNLKQSSHLQTGRHLVAEMEGKLESNMETVTNCQAEKKALFLETVPRLLLPLTDMPGRKDLEPTGGFIGVMTLILTFDFANALVPGDYGDVVQLGVAYLNHLFGIIDSVSKKYNLTRIPSHSDEFTLVAGLPFSFKHPVNFAIMAAVELMKVILHPKKYLRSHSSKSGSGVSSAATTPQLPSERSSSNVGSRNSQFDMKNLPHPTLQIVVDCGEAVASLISFPDLSYYCVVGPAVSTARRLASLCPNNCITVTSNVKTHIASSEFARDYDFQKIKLDEVPSLKDLKHEPKSAYGNGLLKLSNYPDDESSSSEATSSRESSDNESSGTEDSGPVSELTRVSVTSSAVSITGSRSEPNSLLEQLGLNEFLAHVEEKRKYARAVSSMAGATSANGGGSSSVVLFATGSDVDEFELEGKQQRSMLDTVEFDDELVDEDDHKKAGNRHAHKLAALKERGRRDDDAKDDSDSSRRPSYDSGELTKWAPIFNNVKGKCPLDQDDGKRLLGAIQDAVTFGDVESARTNSRHRHHTPKPQNQQQQQQQQRQKQQHNHAPVVKNISMQKCLPNDVSCSIS